MWGSSRDVGACVGKMQKGRRNRKEEQGSRQEAVGWVFGEEREEEVDERNRESRENRDAGKNNGK